MPTLLGEAFCDTGILDTNFHCTKMIFGFRLKLSFLISWVVTASKTVTQGNLYFTSKEDRGTDLKAMNGTSQETGIKIPEIHEGSSAPKCIVMPRSASLLS